VQQVSQNRPFRFWHFPETETESCSPFFFLVALLRSFPRSGGSANTLSAGRTANLYFCVSPSLPRGSPRFASFRCVDWGLSRCNRVPHLLQNVTCTFRDVFFSTSRWESVAPTPFRFLMHCVSPVPLLVSFFSRFARVHIPTHVLAIPPPFYASCC